MNWKDNIREYFSFSRRERLAVLLLTAIIMISLFTPRFLNDTPSNAVLADTTWMSAAASLTNPHSDTMDNGILNGPHYEKMSESSRTGAMGITFYFDPNTLDPSGWKKLGLRDKTIKTIEKFRSKGGRFRSPEDLSKIYGLSEPEYKRLAPFVNIGQAKNTSFPGETKSYLPAPKRIIEQVDVNRADTSAFIALPGIGSKLARRIISFRERLGGFYSIEQVGETFGLADSVFKKIRPFLKLEKYEVQTININTAGIDELKAHPYIRYTLAQPIIAYRNEHGRFTKPEDIRKIHVITDSLYTRIHSYIRTER